MTWKHATRAGLPMLLAAVLFAGAPSASRAQTCNASNDPSLAIIRTAELRFGQLIPTAAPGTAIIDAASGARTVTGGVVAAGGAFNPGAFSVLLCGSAGPKRFDILLPAGAVTISNGAATMTVDTWTVDPGPNNVSGSTSTTTAFSVGGTLHVGANQAGGFYSGTFSVTVARQ